MRAKRAYRNRRSVEVSVLDALVDRAEGGMTVFEVRAAVDRDIDAIEAALAALKSDDLITVEQEETGVLIYPADHVVPDPSDVPDDEAGFLDSLRSRLGF